MAIHWQIPFKSLRSGTDYTVNVYDSAFTGTPVVLKGGAHPFTTEEDDDEDPFAPVRPTTGYLTIIDDGYAADGTTPFNWLDLMPLTETSRPLTLTSGNETLFVGYIQAQNFTGSLFGGVQERKVPVRCVLSTLEGIDVDTTNPYMANFASLLRDALTAPGHPVAFTDFYFHGGTSARQQLLLLTDPQLLISVEDDGIEPARTYGELLEDICTYFGWTCRTQGTAVYFSRCDTEVGDGLLRLTAAQLATMAAGSSAGTSSLIPNPTALSGDIFLSDDIDDVALRGYGKAIVHADADPLDEELIECWPDSAVKEMRSEGWQDTIYHDGDTSIRYTEDLTELDTPLFSGTTSNVNYASFNVGYIESSSTEFAALIRVKRNYYASAAPYVQLETHYEHDYNMCMLSLAALTYKKAEKLTHANKDGVGRYYMTMRLGIGESRATAKWLHLEESIGYEWADSPYEFYASLANQNSDLYFVSSYDDKGYPNGVTLRNVATSGLSGRIFVDILGSDRMQESGDTAAYARSFELKDFTVKISNVDLDDTPASDTSSFPTESVDEKEYSSTNGSGFTDTYDIDTIFCSYPYASFGSGRIDVSDTDLTPEQTLADRIANFWHNRRRLLRPVIRASALPDGVINKILTIDGCQTIASSIRRDWWDDEVTLMLIGQNY